MRSIASPTGLSGSGIASTGTSCGSGTRSRPGYAGPQQRIAGRSSRWRWIRGGLITRCSTGAARCSAIRTPIAIRAPPMRWNPPSSGPAAGRFYRQSGGVQFMTINTLYQLYAAAQQGDPTLEAADTLLMMPDLFGYWLTGEKACEFTDATTTQFYNGGQQRWARGLLEELGIPTHFLPKLIQPGTQLGVLRQDVAEETGLGPLPVIAVAGHDTASAVVAVPAAEAQFAWLSSGTWSLLGGVADAPIVTEQALAYNFSSYGGAGGQFLPWKNIMGLWLVQECRRAWTQEGLDLDSTI